MPTSDVRLHMTSRIAADGQSSCFRSRAAPVFLVKWFGSHRAELVVFALEFWWLERRSIFLAGCVILGATGMQLYLPVLAKEITEFSDGSFTSLMLACGKMASLIVAYHATSLAGHLMSYSAGEAVYRRMVGCGMVAVCSTCSWDSLATQNPSATSHSVHLSSKTACDALGAALTDILASLFTAIGLLVAVLYISTKTTVMVGIVVASMQLFSHTYKRRNHSTAGRMAAHQESYLVALLTNIVQRSGTVRVFRCGDILLERLSRQLEAHAAANALLNFSIHAHAAVVSGSTNALFVVLLSCMSYWHSRGELEVVDIAMYFVFLQQLLNRILSIATESEKFLSLIERIGPLHTLICQHNEDKTVANESTSACTSSSVAAHILGLEDVWYEYPLTQETFQKSSGELQENGGKSGRGVRGVSFSVIPGTFTALCGESGSGKSTCLGLLSGLISPKHGRVYTSPFPALMEQQHSLFFGTIRENIAAGVSLPKRARMSPTELNAIVEHAARRSGCYTFITSTLPQKFDTLIENADSAQLSGGQMQRICLARVFASDTTLVLFDEPTTGLDEAATNVILDSLNELVREGRTVVVATHDKRVVKAAHHIVDIAPQKQ